MSSAFVQSVWTVIVFVVFIGIVVWAYSSRRKADFDKAGRMAMDDDKPLSQSDRKANGSNMNHSNISAAANNGSNIEE